MLTLIPTKPRYRFDNATQSLIAAAPTRPITDKTLPEIGDIIVNTWGWEQTNADFYRVEKAGKKFLELTRLESKVTSDGPLMMSGYALPGGRASTAFEKHSFRVWPDGYVTIKFKHGSGRVWNGKPVRTTWYG